MKKLTKIGKPIKPELNKFEDESVIRLKQKWRMRFKDFDKDVDKIAYIPTR